ncbi:MAG TPA: DUF2127 domain-containing protein [Candidatus Acidoferrum sp.]|nr:DUF2127 domain-containing protein [Candidatus Acidoferrum sp.]
MKAIAKTLLHDSFRAGITLKGIDGLFEMAGGILLWFIYPERLARGVRRLLLHELSKNPHDFIATHLLHSTMKLAAADPVFASVYLVTHGLVKALLVIALWFDKIWAYPLTIAVFGAFAVYQTYRFFITESAFMAILTVFDALIIYLTWMEFREQKRLRSAARSAVPASPAAPN